MKRAPVMMKLLAVGARGMGEEVGRGGHDVGMGGYPRERGVHPPASRLWISGSKMLPGSSSSSL